MNEMLDMKLHEIRYPDTKSSYEILRVPGGWMYTAYFQQGDGNYAQSSCFVPETTTTKG